MSPARSDAADDNCGDSATAATMGTDGTDADDADGAADTDGGTTTGAAGDSMRGASAASAIRVDSSLLAFEFVTDDADGMCDDVGTRIWDESKTKRCCACVGLSVPISNQSGSG